MSEVYLCVHGHFYQPPRCNPFTGSIDHEPAAAPFHDFNEKIWDECYRANAELGNFGLMSFDLGPTLAEWMHAAHPSTLTAITDAAQGVRAASGHGNALAQAYHHTILPLATSREKRLEIAWGISAFRQRFGYAPEGMWLPEAAVDDETLALLAQAGLTYTVLAPWQAAVSDVDTTEPYRADVGDGRTLDVFFYDARLSGGVSFDGNLTSDAGRFSAADLGAHVNASKRDAGIPQIILIATDGELYGHHKPFRDLFLSRLLHVEAAAHGYRVATLGDYLAAHGPSRHMAVRPGTSWSCTHGVARWSDGCPCTEGDSSWKGPLRAALRNLATRLDSVFEDAAREVLRDPWNALEDYVELRNGAVSASEYASLHALDGALTDATERRAHGLLEMQFARHAMFVSCAWFFEDLDRIEPRIALMHAHHAVALAAEHTGADLTRSFLADLQHSVSARTGRSGADLYRSVDSGQRSAVSGQPSAVSRQRSAVSRQPSMTRD